MKSLTEWFSGRKVYIGMIAGGCLGIAYAQGWVDDTVAATVASIIAAWTGVAIRAAWSKGK